VVNYLDHVKGAFDSEDEYEESSHVEPGISRHFRLIAAYSEPKEVWTREVPTYIRLRAYRTPSPSPGSSHSLSSQSSTSSRHSSMPQAPAQMKRHPLNIPTLTSDEKTEDTSVINQPSHAILGHIAIKNYANDGILATAVTMRYKHKVPRIGVG
jgi:5'-AMP-activated protein kinase beta subunit, interaction domain